MRIFKIIVLKKKTICIAAFAAVLLITSIFLLIHFVNLAASTFIDPKSGIIVIDPGHGGVDGGTSRDGMLEKAVNLAIAKKLKASLEQKGYKIIMTREADTSLDGMNNSSSSRHQRDLNARVDIINSSNAQLFLSIHVNSNFKRPASDGSIVYYYDRFKESKTAAYCIQRALNNMIVNGRNRTVHEPQQADFTVLSNSRVPGILIETAFISNDEEKKLLAKDEFLAQLAKAITNGVEQYLNRSDKVFAPELVIEQEAF